LLKVLGVDDGSFKPCNFACKYCRKYPSKKLADGYFDPIRGSTSFNQYRNQHTQVITVLEDKIESTFYKISGHGEISLIPDFLGLLPSSFGKPILITNGSRLKERDLPKLAEIDAVLSISLDGHTSILNTARSGKVESVLSLIRVACDYDIPIEINSVLSKWNMEDFDEFLFFLKKFSNLVCFPFPVRDFSTQLNESYKASYKQFQVFKEKVLDNYQEFNYILPPFQYLENMLSTMKIGRQIPCFLPNIIISLNWQFDILKCPCGPTGNLGNLLNSPNKALNQWKKQSEKYSKKFLFHECNQCYTHFDIINLYLLGKITSLDLRKIPSLSNTKTTKFLKEYSTKCTKEN